MVYSESLKLRVAHQLSHEHGIVEKKMFGGVGFLLSGNMLVGIWRDSLIARVGMETAEESINDEFVGPFDVTGRPMKGWLMVEPEGVDTDQQLRRWLDLALEFVRTLPAK